MRISKYFLKIKIMPVMLRRAQNKIGIDLKLECPGARSITKWFSLENL
jgi:hypothetical protein